MMNCSFTCYPAIWHQVSWRDMNLFTCGGRGQEYRRSLACSPQRRQSVCLAVLSYTTLVFVIIRVLTVRGESYTIPALKTGVPVFLVLLPRQSKHRDV